jgi:hypothetical protein
VLININSKTIYDLQKYSKFYFGARIFRFRSPKKRKKPYTKIDLPHELSEPKLVSYSFLHDRLQFFKNCLSKVHAGVVKYIKKHPRAKSHVCYTRLLHCMQQHYFLPLVATQYYTERRSNKIFRRKINFLYKHNLQRRLFTELFYKYKYKFIFKSLRLSVRKYPQKFRRTAARIYIYNTINKYTI